MLAYSVLSALLLWMALPPVDWGWLAWVALVPLCLALAQAQLARFGCLIGLAWGFCFYGVLLWWMQQFVSRWTGSFWLGLVAWLALVLSQVLFAGLLGWLTVGLRHRVGGEWLPAAWFAGVWVTLEWLRGAGAWGFLWGQPAVTQHRLLITLQSAELLGAWGLSAWIVLVNAAIAETILCRRWSRTLLVVLLSSLVLLLFGWWKLSTPYEAQRLTALVVQPNVDTTHDWNIAMQQQVQASMERVIDAIASQKVDLVLFPETLLPDATAYPFAQIIERANSMGSTVLIGAFVEEGAQIFNTVTAFMPNGSVEHYRKQHLIPWGEYVPLRQWTPWIEHFGVPRGNVSRGNEPGLLTSWRIGTPICFESTLPRISCEMAREGARLLCVVTIDTWFQRSPASEQHLAYCALRAVETRRWVLRSAATGISAIFDTRGRCVQRAELFTEAFLREDSVELQDNRTLYTWLGDDMAFVTLLGLLIAWGMLEVRGLKTRAAVTSR